MRETRSATGGCRSVTADLPRLSAPGLLVAHCCCCPPCCAGITLLLSRELGKSFALGLEEPEEGQGAGDTQDECTLLACAIHFAGGKGKAIIQHKNYVRGLPPFSLQTAPLLRIYHNSSEWTRYATEPVLMSDGETTPSSLLLMWNNSLANVVCPQRLERDPPPEMGPSDKAQKKNAL